jgi:hypothetical protein
VVPIVKLGWAMMPTSNFGPRPRPEFIVDDWQIFRGDQLTQIEAPKPAEELNDAIGF